MSHHLDTPLAAQNGQLYIDDLYLFGSKDGTVFVIQNDPNGTAAVGGGGRAGAALRLAYCLGRGGPALSFRRRVLQWA